RRSERLVALRQQDLRSDPLEADDASLASLAAIEADVVRAESRGKSGGQQELRIDAWNLQEHRSGAVVPVERKTAVDLLHARRPVLDRLIPRLRRTASATAAALSRD